LNRSPPTRSLRDHPELDRLKRQGNELLQAFAAEVNAQYRDADPPNFALHDPQLVLSRACGFDAWPKLKAHVDGRHRQAADRRGQGRVIKLRSPGNAADSDRVRSFREDSLWKRSDCKSFW
jgi:hypothetical protein